jgi:hypothetical protein
MKGPTKEMMQDKAVQTVEFAEKAGLDFGTLMKLLDLVQKYGPLAMEVLQKLIDAFQQPRLIGTTPEATTATAPVACPPELKGCCKAALDSALQTVAILTHACHCTEETK